ncbi:leucine-rich repeat-containing protein 69 isoform X3 [Canis lupus baileyi]|uniref:leucine-rich repeat-containing protein 69 isoform X3 n=1 Tax=Canis lupus familiaris TaxID=9615 RepID=UPI0003ADBBB7|nr:leucine-rich repeat-containing protein 69 isoform X3 [Canis lupus familiaris]XP_038297511.1 leucine-rich repeat-containing protein 69 isoform X3 [Canis lupus familiaris]|eukprot:XP_005638166.1 leucine-rich repeat-containing protein 69 isoform X3 [Canis lupus familiaris]
MTERLLIRALKGGKDTKIVTLNGKGITKMPSALSKLPGLKTLDLQNNQIRKVCPEISTLTQLTALNLGNNLLEEIPEEMKYLTSLKKLHLFGNKICKFAPGVCGGLQHLILLNLNNNRLTWIPQEVSSYNRLLSLPEEIKFLKKLQKLVLIRNNIEVLPEGLRDLQNLRILDIAGNIIQILPSGFQNLKLREFYCEGNPLFLMKPVNAIQQEDAWSLQEITSRFIMNELEGKSPFIMQAIQRHPQVRNIISQRRKCAICGKYFLTIWLECVEFVPPPKNWKISRNLKLVPLRILICSYKCFNKRGLNLFGIAQV